MHCIVATNFVTGLFNEIGVTIVIAIVAVVVMVVIIMRSSSNYNA